MSKNILQINFQFSVSREELDAMVSGLGEAIAAVPGLRWKIWIVNEENRESGGLYLFADEASLDAYVDGPLISGLKSNPAFSGISIKKFASMPAATALTHGPVQADDEH